MSNVNNSLRLSPSNLPTAVGLNVTVHFQAAKSSTQTNSSDSDSDCYTYT